MIKDLKISKKTMENVRKRRLIDIVQTSDKLKKLVAQPTYIGKNDKCLNERLLAL